MLPNALLSYKNATSTNERSCTNMDNKQVLEKVGDNDYRAEYRSKVCTAIFNPFVGLYYVDDVYGVVSERK